MVSLAITYFSSKNLLLFVVRRIVNITVFFYLFIFYLPRILYEDGGTPSDGQVFGDNRCSNCRDRKTSLAPATAFLAENCCRLDRGSLRAGSFVLGCAAAYFKKVNILSFGC
jgi:hypothetical protein